MSEATITNDMGFDTHFKVKEITLNDPWTWLAKGWADLTKVPHFSLTYGLVFVLVSYLILWGLIDGEMFFMLPLLAAGFFLSAPILGIGLYGISRSLEHNNEVEFCQIKKAWLSNPAHISAMGLLLMMIMLFWIFAAIIIFILFYNAPMPEWNEFFSVVFFSGEHTLFLMVGFTVGGLIALSTFVISVVTVPILMDKQVDFMTAIKISVNVVKKNIRPMLLWAYLIGLFVSIGFVTYFIALFITMPIIGHATWHAYRDLVEEEH